MRQGHSKKEAIRLMSAKMGRRGNQKRSNRKPLRGSKPHTRSRPSTQRRAPTQIKTKPAQPKVSKTPPKTKKTSSGFMNTLRSLNTRIPLRYKLLILLLILNIIFPTPVIFVTDVIFVLVWGEGWLTSCPRCHEHFARKVVDVTDHGMTTVWRDRAHTTTQKDAHGNVVSSSSTTHRVPVSTRVIQRHYVCKKCGYTFSGRVTTEK